MRRFYFSLLTALSCLVAADVPGQVSPLRSQAEALAPNDRGIATPLLDECAKQSPLPTVRNLGGVAWATATHGFAAGDLSPWRFIASN